VNARRFAPKFGLWVAAFAAALMLLLVGAWTWWGEDSPEQERQLRNLVQDHLTLWFPEQMHPSTAGYGLIPVRPETPSADVPRVLLVHGLDEPGGIWDELIPALEASGMGVWEFRYPNDQAIDRSADLLADEWAKLVGERPVVLVGHSMGGLVIRDFVSRHRHPVGASPLVEGPDVGGAILIGTPSQGSDWARLRVWLELRELFAVAEDRRFSLFAALRDGTGAAKIDLRPGSAFLADLNSRAWPEAVPLGILGGSLPDPPPSLESSLRAISEDLVSDELEQALRDWWLELGKGLGDGVVPVASLSFPGAPSPILMPASHRGLLVRRFALDPEPQTIGHVLGLISEWHGSTGFPMEPHSANESPFE